jgi:glycosyltransferase involved in cell wall biosynthesis
LRVTAVIPAYNEAPRIERTIRSVLPLVDEVLVINDGSQDNTAQVAEKAGAVVLNQPTNRGYIPAIKLGFQSASGDIVVTIDADGEFPADKIPELIQPIVRGDADMVQGRREFVPRPSEKFLTFLANLKAPVGDTGTGFRALTTELARKLDLNGVCICGIFSLEVIKYEGIITEIQFQLKEIDKPRRIAWYHIRQFFYLLPWLMKKL